MALPSGTQVTLKRGAETEVYILSGEENAAIVDALTSGLGIVLDGLGSLRTEDRKLIEAHFKAMSAVMVQQAKLSDMAMSVACNTHKLNCELSGELGLAYKDRNTLQQEIAALRVLRPQDGSESWANVFGQAMTHAPQIAAVIRLLMSPLPPSEPANDSQADACREGA